MSDTPDNQPPETFNRGERYTAASEERADAAPSGPRPPSLLGLYWAGGAMIAATVVGLLLGAPAWLAALVGLALFIVLARQARRRADAALAARRVRPASGVDVDAAQARLDAAEEHLRVIDAAAKRLADRGLAAPLRQMTAAIRRVLDRLADDPADMGRARAFLRVTAPSARAAVEKFEKLGVRDAQLDERFRALIGEVTAAAEAQEKALAADEKIDLEVEMAVLEDRLRS